MDYTSLKKDTTKANAPGLKKRVLLAARSWFDLLAAPTVGTTPESRVTITADHTFVAGQGWIELYTTLDTASLVAELIGERDSRSTNPKVECFHPGIRKEAVGFGESAKNDEWIALVEDLDGNLIQLGEDGLECDLTYSLGTGTVSSGRNGITFTIENYGKVYFYEGDITMKPVTP